MEYKNHTVLAIGAHIGDAELTAGALLATCAVHGGKAVTLALTAGEKGAPAGADIEEYRRSKIAEAEAFARELGGEAYVLDYADGLLPDSISVGGGHFIACSMSAEKSFCSPYSPAIWRHPGNPAAPVVQRRSL